MQSGAIIVDRASFWSLTIFTLTRLVHCGAIITVLDVTPVDEYEFM